jgi:preprotein translocase subunit SecG
MTSNLGTQILAAMGWGQWLLAVLLIFVCFLLMIVILLQKGRGGGLAGAFGGAGGTSAFGAKTGDVFTWITVVVAAIFVLLTVVGNFAFDQSAGLKPTATAEPATEELPFEVPEGAKPGEPIKFELGTTDPVTGEKKTMLVPVGPGGTPTGTIPAQPYPAGMPPPSPVTPQPEPKPEDQPPEPPQDEKQERPNP